MSKGKKHVADSIRLPGEMVETLKVMAESEGERGYQRSENGSKNACIKKPEVDRRRDEGVSKPAAGSPATIRRLKLTRILYRAIWKALSSN